MTRQPDQEEFDPCVNAEEIAIFAEELFSYLEGFVPTRLLTEKGMPAAPPQSVYPPADKSLGSELTRLAASAATSGRALFVVTCTVPTRGRAKAENLVATQVIVVDLDEGDIAAKRAHLARYLGEPTLEVASGGKTEAGQEKLHLYWRLSEPAAEEDLEVVAFVRSRIAEVVGGDSSFGRLTQPIRVAGSIHGKFGVRSPVRIVSRYKADYDLGEFLERVEEMPALSGHAGTDGKTSRRGRARPSAKDLMRRVIRENGLDDVTRYEAIGIVAGYLIWRTRIGALNPGTTWDRLLAYNANQIAPPWPEGRLRQTYERLLARDHARNADAWKPRTGEEAGDGTQPPAFSDDALAANFVEKDGAEWRFVPAWGKWLRWTGTHWAEDTTRGVAECIRQTCRVAAATSSAGEGRRLASAKTMAAVERVLMADPTIARTVESFDSDNWVLNTRDGILDLRTGVLGPHDREAQITRLAQAGIDGACPLWLKFLGEVTAGDNELIGYLRRLAGYCLTGSTREQIFAFFHGYGGNGKTVLLQVWAHVLGDYAMTAALDTFMTSQGDRHSTDLASLRGSRLVIVAETEPGRTWAESRIKAIAGGDRISARFLYRDNFEFLPTFKLVVAGNHRPGLRSLGEAMRRRLHLVPFSHTIPEARRDKDLVAKLKAEADGILGWMVGGCLEWQRLGLAPPAAVTGAGKAYFEEEDIVGQWIAEQCDLGLHFKVSARALFASWKAFAETGGHPILSQKALGEALRERHFEPTTVQRSRGWSGLRLRQSGGDA